MPNLFEIMQEVNNFFVVENERISLEITATTLVGDFENEYIAGQYIMLKNSLLNDGVYKITNVTANTLTLDATLQVEDTERVMCLSALKIPPSFLTLANEIISNGSNEGVQSESVSRYSVSYAEGGKSWASLYRKALNNWRKMRWN